MTKLQCKKLDPLVTGNIGSFCVDCLQDTNFRDSEGKQTFRFVDRISADRDVYDKKGNLLGYRDGWLCRECNWHECDRCDERIYCDDDCTPYDVYGDHEPSELSDGAYRVHYDCLTKEEKKLMEVNN